MKIWATNPCDNNLYQAILHNQQINIDIGGDDSQDDTLIIPVIINVYDKTNNTCLSSYSHAMSIIQILTYISSYPRYNKLYDFEVIRLDKVDNIDDNNIHKDESIQLLNEALQEYQQIKDTFASAFESDENRILEEKANNICTILKDKIKSIDNN